MTEHEYFVKQDQMRSLGKQTKTKQKKKEHKIQSQTKQNDKIDKRRLSQFIALTSQTFVEQISVKILHK